jgi:hypothetical protein
MQFTAGGDRYVVPAEAVRHLGSLLDPQLFNVSYLARAGLDDAHTNAVPVHVERAGAGTPALSGLRLGAASAGKVLKSEAGRFGQAHATKSTVDRSPVAGVNRIRLAAPTGAPDAPDLAVVTGGTKGGSVTPKRD